MRLMTSVAAVFIAGSASAQDAGWQYRSTLYLWFPGTTASVETPNGTIEGEVSASDALQSLEMGFMGTVAAQNNNWIIWGDLVYSDLAASKPTPDGVLWTDAEIGQTLTTVTSYVLYDVAPSPTTVVALGAGARYFNLGFSTSLSGGALGDVSSSFDESWTVPVIAGQFYTQLNDKWFVDGTADWGMAGDDTETWQIYAGLGYRFNERWSTQVGYRYMNFVKDIGGDVLDTGLSGLVAGVTIEF
ncbi:MAG: hypothetical protein NTX73_07240 [Rhodobacterales bacterium]|nr:hypothetical protein [Rhodobacterales bacterium]